MTALRNSTASKEFYVYLHRRATDGRVFYVGKGTGGRANSKGGRSDYWKRVVRKHGIIVEYVQTGMQEWWAFELERELIAYYGRENLTNLTDGGEGVSGRILSEESRKKISESNKGKIAHWVIGDKNPMHRPEVKAKVLKHLKKRKISQEMKDHLRQINICKKLSEETKRKIGAKSLGQKHTPETIEKMRIAQSNRSEETRRKIALSKIGKPRPAHVGQIVREKLSKPILCNETGRLFNSHTEAVNWLKSQGKTKAQLRPISDCAKGKYSKAYGYSWSNP